MHFEKICSLKLPFMSLYLVFQNMLSLWNVSSLTMIAFWPHLSIEDFLLLSSSNIQTPGMSKYVTVLILDLVKSSSTLMI